MKKNLIFSLFGIILPVIAFTQDWNLFAPGVKYNYGNPGNSAIESMILAEFSNTSDGDSIFFITPRRAIPVSGIPYAAEIGSFIGDTMVKHTGDVYDLRFSQPTYSFDGTERTIHTRAEVGESWVYKPGITATVTEKTDTTWWDTGDSIKTISLSDGKQIRLSKKFGLFFLDDRTLIGLEGQDVGVQLPSIADFYGDWIPGAVFEFHFLYVNGSSWSNTTQERWTKYYILNKSIAQDTIFFEVHKLQRQENSSTVMGNTTFHPAIFADEITVYAIPEPQKVFYPGGMKDPGFSIVHRTRKYTDVPEGVQLTLDEILYPGYSTDTRIEYKSGLGKTLDSLVYISSPAIRSVTSLLGYQKMDGEPQGTLHPDTFFNNSTSSQETDEFPALKISPNPANDMVYIRCEQCLQATSAEWINPAGQIIRMNHFNLAGASIQTNDLPDGTYFLRIRFENGVRVVRKIVVQH